MASINLYTVLKLAEERNWKVLSESYKNLGTEMTFECPEGHKVIDAFKHWRQYPICLECERENRFNFSKKIPAKDSNKKRVLSLDAATQVSGWALFDSGQLVGYGTISFLQTDVTARINSFKHWLAEAIKKWQPDLIALEDIQLQTYGRNDSMAQVKVYNRLARAQGVNLDIIYEAKVDFVIISSSEWRKFCDVSGKTRAEKKKSAKIRVKMWYGIDANEDEADSICLGRCAVSKSKKEELVNWE